jgi:hypothetical protein
MKVCAAAALAAIALANCTTIGQIATNVSTSSATTTGGAICAAASTAKATLTLSAKQTAVFNPALASCAATSNGRSATVVTAVPALLAGVATLQQVGLI